MLGGFNMNGGSGCLLILSTLISTIFLIVLACNFAGEIGIFAPLLVVILVWCAVKGATNK